MSAHHTDTPLFDQLQDSEVEYRLVPGFTFYRVGSDGSVWSCRTRGGLFVDWQLMTPQDSRKNGRRYVGFRKDGKLRSFAVHRLVLMAFVGPCPPGMEACHEDGDPLNNNLNNLRWGTHISNMEDRTRHGRGLEGERNGCAKLTASQVKEIRRRCKDGELHSVIAADYDVCKSHISSIYTRRIWKKV